MKSKKALIVIAVILFILNVMLMYSNIQRQNRINILTGQIIYHEREQAGRQYPGEAVYVKEGQKINDGLSLILIFSDIDCVACLGYEIPNLNRFYTRFPDRATVFYVGKDSLLLKRAGAEFPYTIVDDASTILPDYFKIDNSLGLIVDSNNMIHGVYRPETEHEEKSSKFYKKTHSLFESFK